MDKFTIYLTPYEYACVKQIGLPEIFTKIKLGEISIIISECGILIPVTYSDMES